MEARTSREPQPFASKLCFQGFHELLPDLLLLQEGGSTLRLPGLPCARPCAGHTTCRGLRGLQVDIMIPTSQMGKLRLREWLCPVQGQPASVAEPGPESRKSMTELRGGSCPWGVWAGYLKEALERGRRSLRGWALPSSTKQTRCQK